MASLVTETTRTAHVRPQIEHAEKDESSDPSVAAKSRRVIDLRPKID